MVFSRPTEPTPPAPKKYPKTKRGKAEKERDRWLALTPEQRVKEEQERQRKVAEERAIQEKRWAEERNWHDEQEVLRKARAAEEAAKKEREAEIERRAGIQWPGSVVDPNWLAKHAAIDPAKPSVPFETQYAQAIDESLIPLKNDHMIGLGVLEDRTLKDVNQNTLAAAIRNLLVDALECVEVQTPVDHAKFWGAFGGGKFLGHFLTEVAKATNGALDDHAFTMDITDSLRCAARTDALDHMYMIELVEEMGDYELDQFLTALHEDGFIRDPLNA